MPRHTVHELTFATANVAPLASTEADRRACIRALARCLDADGRPGAIGFALRGDRLRLLVTDDAGRVGRLRGAIFRSIGHVVRPRLAPPDVRRLDHRAHIVGVLRHYVAPRDGEGFGVPPALASGSCLPDLVGARCVPGLRLVTAQVLPRLRQRELFDWLELGRPVTPATDQVVGAVGATRLVEAAGFAVAAATVAGANTPERVAARRAVVAIAGRAGIGTGEVARALGATPRSVRRLAGASPDPPIERAVRMRIALEEAVRRQLLGPAGVA